MLKALLLAIIADLNENTTDNPEYLRGQVEMARDLLGYTDDGDELRFELTQAANKTGEDFR